MKNMLEKTKIRCVMPYMILNKFWKSQSLKLSVFSINASCQYTILRYMMSSERKGTATLGLRLSQKKGANEIGTCVFIFIEMMVKIGVKEFRFWSDNCGGQNKYQFLFSMYTHAAAKFQVVITHKYMEVGHTMNEADRMHAPIERAARFLAVYDPSGWVNIT